MVALSRITLQQSIERQARLSVTIADLEAAIASGKKLAQPSADPQAWTELSATSRRRSDIAAVQGPVSVASARAAQADRWLGAVADDLARARELVIAAGGAPGVGRSALVSELTAIRSDLDGRFGAVTASGESLLDTGGIHRISLGEGRTTDIVPHIDAVRLLPDGTAMTDVLDRAMAAASSGDPADIAAALTALDTATVHVATEQARQGVRMQRLEEAAQLLAEQDVDLALRQSELGDTDIAAAITTIQSLAVQRDAARAMLSRTSAQTLFDYLR